MNSLVGAKEVRFDQDSFCVDLSDGRTLGVALAWFPRLLRDTVASRRAACTGKIWTRISPLRGCWRVGGDRSRARKMEGGV